MRKLISLSIIQMLIVFVFYVLMATFMGGVLGYLVGGVVAHLIGAGLE